MPFFLTKVFLALSAYKGVAQCLRNFQTFECFQKARKAFTIPNHIYSMHKRIRIRSKKRFEKCAASCYILVVFL